MQNTCLRTSAPNDGDVAQLGEHHVRNVGVVGSNPIISTIEIPTGQAIAWPVLFCTIKCPFMQGWCKSGANLFPMHPSLRVSPCFGVVCGSRVTTLFTSGKR